LISSPAGELRFSKKPACVACGAMANTCDGLGAVVDSVVDDNIILAACNHGEISSDFEIPRAA
jgi:hypothetical protein